MVLLRHVLSLAGLLLEVATATQATRPYNKSLRRRHGIRGRDLPDAPVNSTEPVLVHGAYTIELNDGFTAADVASQLEALGISIQTRRVLDSSLFKGSSFSVTNAGADYNAATIEATISEAAAVKQVWPVRRVKLPPDDDKSPAADMRRIRPGVKRAVDEPYSPHVMTQVDLVHKAGFTGKGVKIAVLDTGINYNHPLLGGCFGPGCLVESGWDTVGVDYIEDDLELEGDDDPLDCHGHGTHVAGIISALPNDLGFKGVAPGALLSAYRVLDCYGWGTDDTIVDGMLRAFDDGNDILTLSLGKIGGYPEDVMSITATRIIEAGVPVFVSVGNNGMWEGMFQPESPSDGDLVTAVASYDPLIEPVVTLIGEFTTGEGETGEIIWNPVLVDFGDVAELEFPVIDLNSFTDEDSTPVTGCRPLPATIPDLSGYLVLVEGTTDFDCWWDELQQANIYAGGGTNIMFWLDDKDSEFFNDNIPIREGMNVVWMLSPGHKQIREALASGSNVTVTLSSTPRIDWSVNEKTGGDVSAFSTWGPNWDMRSAPSVGAPGHNILSTWLGESVHITSGTSMSTPFVAAAAALLIEARGTRDPKTIHGLLTGTASQVPLSKSVFGDLGGLHPPTQAGTGIIQVLDAIQAKGVLSTTGISFNDTDHHIDEVSFTLKNTGDKDVEYQLGYTSSLTTYAMDTEDHLAVAPFDTVESYASLSFSSNKVTVSAGGEARITVRCKEPQGVDASRWPVYSGYITLNGTNGDNLAISYVGNAGPMRDGVVIPDTVPEWFTNWHPDQVFTIPQPIPGEDAPEDVEYPFVDIIPRLRTRKLRVHLLPLPSNSTSTNGTNPSPCQHPTETWLDEKTSGEVLGSPFINPAPDFAWPSEIWVTGHLANGKVAPTGRYRLMVSALGVFRDPASNSTGDWWVAKSAPFILRYVR